MFIFFLIIIIVAGLAWIGYIIYKRLPDLRNLDTSSISREKQSQAKANILQARLARHGQMIRNRVGAMMKPRHQSIVSVLTKIKNKATALEEKYLKPKAAPIKPATIKDLLQEADQLLGRGDYLNAEKKLIEAVAMDNKNNYAYEMLGDLYFENKDYGQAEEIFRYLIKLHTASHQPTEVHGSQSEEAELEYLSETDVDTKLAVYYSNLGEVYEITNKNDKALDCYLKAISADPNNPKYLDKLIDTSLQAGDKALAKKAFNQLRKINPENAKLAELQAAIEKN